MKKFFATAAAISVMASSAMAGSLTLADGDTIQVTRNGITYICKNEIEIIDGVPSRRCVRADDDGGALFAGGLGSGAAIGLGVLGLIVLAAAIDDDDDATTGTD